MNTLRHTFNWLAMAAMLIGAPALADERRVDFDINAGLGANYDSNVALVELDSSAGEPDAATAFEAGLGMKARIGNDFRLRVGYDYSGTRHREFTDFDLDLHHGHVSLTLHKGSVDSVVAVDRFEGVLSGEDYLVQTQVSPSVSTIFGTRWYLRGAYTHAVKSFAASDDRDATSDALRVDTYLLFDGMDHYLALGAQALAEDAFSKDHDFDSAMAQLGWGYRIDRPGIDVRLKAQLRYERRDYDAVILESGRARVDERVRVKLAATVPFSKRVSVGASIEHTRNTSGRAEASLERSIFAMEFGVAF